MTGNAALKERYGAEPELSGVHLYVLLLLGEIRDVRGGDRPLRFEANLKVDDRKRLACDLLQELNWYYVIERPALKTQQYGQKRMLREMVRTFYEDERLLPPDRKEELDEHGDRIRAAADHVASLTEATAIALYRRLLGVNPGLHSDPIWGAY